MLLFGGSAAAIAATVYYIWRFKYTRKDELKDSNHTFAYEALIGNTPMIQLKAASQLTGCRILVKVPGISAFLAKFCKKNITSVADGIHESGRNWERSSGVINVEPSRAGKKVEKGRNCDGRNFRQV